MALSGFYMKDKKQVIESIKQNKIIAIIRGVEEDKTAELIGALYDGGIRAAEFAFGGDEEKTARMIKIAVKNFGDCMQIGAGTVTNARRLDLALSSGAAYVITPVCDASFVSRCKAEGVCTVIGSLTPTEIKTAADSGADFVKLFPADAFGPRYIKSVLAPLEGVNIIAFGGITQANVNDYLNAGAVAVGIGAELVDKAAIALSDFAPIVEKAKALSFAVKQRF